MPLTPGGVGPVDIALIALLTSFGAPGPSAVAAAVIWRLFWFLPQLASGGVATIVFLVSRKRQHLREATASPR